MPDPHANGQPDQRTPLRIDPERIISIEFRPDGSAVLRTKTDGHSTARAQPSKDAAGHVIALHGADAESFLSQLKRIAPDRA